MLFRKIMCLLWIMALSFGLWVKTVYAYADQDIVYSEVAGRLGGTEEAVWLTEAIVYAGNLYGIDPLLLTAVMEAESGFAMGELSETGAAGYMQLMPKTAAGLGVDRFNPWENILGGTCYLRMQMDKFAGDGAFGLTEAVAAYNAGSSAVEMYGGVPPYRETQNYVSRIARIYGSLLSEADY